MLYGSVVLECFSWVDLLIVVGHLYFLLIYIQADMMIHELEAVVGRIRQFLHANNKFTFLNEHTLVF